MNETDREFYKRTDRTFIAAIVINSMVIYGILFMGIVLGMINQLDFLISNQPLMIYSCFTFGFGISVFQWNNEIRKYEKLHGI